MSKKSTIIISCLSIVIVSLLVMNTVLFSRLNDAEELYRQVVEKQEVETTSITQHGITETAPPPQLSEDPAVIKLRQEIHETASEGHKPLSYREVWIALEDIYGEGEQVRLFYSQSLRLKTLRSRNKKEDWNREHLWPNSYGLLKRGHDYTDIHNLRPCDSMTNQRRGNKYFGIETTGDSWNVPEQLRGDVARAMFYMDIRYDGLEPSTEDLSLVQTDEIDRTKGKFGPLNILLKWHKEDPVDDAERAHNEGVKKWQGNTNPFIDDPTLVTKIWGEAR